MTRPRTAALVVSAAAFLLSPPPALAQGGCPADFNADRAVDSGDFFDLSERLLHGTLRRRFQRRHAGRLAGFLRLPGELPGVRRRLPPPRRGRAHRVYIAADQRPRDDLLERAARHAGDRTAQPGEARGPVAPAGAGIQGGPAHADRRAPPVGGDAEPRGLRGDRRFVRRGDHRLCGAPRRRLRRRARRHARRVADLRDRRGRRQPAPDHLQRPGRPRSRPVRRGRGAFWGYGSGGTTISTPSSS